LSALRPPFKSKEFVMLETRSLVTAIVLSAFLTVGCQKKDEPALTSTPANKSRAAEGERPHLDKPLDVDSSTLVHGDITGVAVDVKELRLTGESLTLRFTLSSDHPMSLGYQFGEGDQVKDNHSVGAVYLLDSTNKKYPVMRDSDGACMCSRNVPPLSSRSPILLWAKFSAVPNDLRKVTVVIPHFPPFENVAVTREQ
jgi:hypothetical protein